MTFTPDLYAAAIPYVAPSNLITLIKSFPAYWGPFIKRWYLRVGDPDSDVSRLLRRRRYKTLKPEKGLGPQMYYLF